jgi:hypothetical protein
MRGDRCDECRKVDARALEAFGNDTFVVCTLYLQSANFKENSLTLTTQWIPVCLGPTCVRPFSSFDLDSGLHDLLLMVKLCIRRGSVINVGSYTYVTHLVTTTIQCP